MKHIIVAPWGNPYTWSPITYKIKVNGKEITVSNAKTSLACLNEVFKPDMTLLLIPETLSCPGIKYEGKFRKHGGLLPSEKLESSYDIYQATNNYREVVRNLRRAIEELYSEWVKKNSCTTEVIIVPNVGRYLCSSNKETKTVEVWWRIGIEKVDPISAYAAYTLLSIITAIIKISSKSKINSLRLILDTTHGINYMPVAAYRATIVATRMISTMLNTPVEFLQYNSEPVIGELSENTIRNIHLVRREYITPSKAAQRIVYSYLVRDAGHARLFHRSRELPIEFHKRLREKENMFRKLISLHSDIHAEALAASIHFSMPLTFLQTAYELQTTYGDVLHLIPEVQSLLTELLTWVMVSGNDDMLNITHLILPNYDDIKSLLAITSLAMYGVNALNYSKQSKMLDIAIRNNIVEASLESLDKICNMYLKGPFSLVANNELGNFESIFSGRRKLADRLTDLIQGAKRNPEKWFSVDPRGCEDQPRIMVAHAGLASRSIEIKVEDDILYVRYKESCLSQATSNNVYNILKHALNSTRNLIKGQRGREEEKAKYQI